MKEGGIGVRDMGDIKKALHMKFAWRLLSKENLWTKFFKAKYAKGEHLTCAKPRLVGSRFWKAICKVIPKVYKHSYTCIREGNVSL